MFRIQSYGSHSEYKSTLTEAELVANEIMSRNGCGMISFQPKNGKPWNVVSRFEPYYGIVPDGANPDKIKEKQYVCH